MSKDAIKRKEQKHTRHLNIQVHTYTHSMNDKMIVMKEGPYGLVGRGGSCGEKRLGT